MHYAFCQVSPEYASYQPCLCLLKDSPAVLTLSSWSQSHSNSFESFGCSWMYLSSTSHLIPCWLYISLGTNPPLKAQLHLCFCLSKVGGSDLMDVFVQMVFTCSKPHSQPGRRQNEVAQGWFSGALDKVAGLNFQCPSTHYNSDFTPKCKSWSVIIPGATKEKYGENIFLLNCSFKDGKHFQCMEMSFNLALLGIKWTLFWVTVCYFLLRIFSLTLFHGVSTLYMITPIFRCREVNVSWKWCPCQ